jgi:hypothetical protein
MRIHPTPREVWEPRRKAILHQLQASGAFDGIRPREGVRIEDLKMAFADTVVAFQFAQERARQVTAPLREWEERFYRRLAKLSVPQDSPRGRIKEAVVQFLEERDYLMGRGGKSKSKRLSRLARSHMSIDRLVVELFGVYRRLANRLVTKREAFFSYHLTRMYEVALPGSQSPEGESLWQRVKLVGGVGRADMVGGLRVSCYPRLRPFQSERELVSYRGLQDLNHRRKLTGRILPKPPRSTPKLLTSGTKSPR